MKYKILELLKKQNNFISGEEIGKIFNISRAAVWKNISKLKKSGYNIISITNKGYFLNNSIDILNNYEIKTSLTTTNIGKEFLYLEETDSTNEEAKRQAQKGVKDGFLIIAENQTKGKGRIGNQWKNSDSSALMFSIILKPSLFPEDVTSLTLITGLSVCNAFRNMGIKSFLKWPNDIIINSKKAVGILTEISCEIEQINYIIIGIGVNINTKNFDKSIEQKATSLFIETNKNFKRIEVLNAILAEFEKNYHKFIDSKSFESFIEEYNNLCINIGKKVKVFSKQEIICGTAVGVTEKGELIIKNDTNDNISIVSGEVSVRLQNGNYI